MTANSTAWMSYTTNDPNTSSTLVSMLATDDIPVTDIDENRSNPGLVMGRLMIITLPSVVGGVFLVVMLLGCCFLIKRRNLKKRHSGLRAEDFWLSGKYRDSSTTATLPRVRESMASENSLALQQLSVNDRLKGEIRNMLIDRKRLQIGDEIGQGEFGTVNLAQLTTRNGTISQVAVKSIKDKYKISELEDFIREGAMSSSLEHDNILQVIGISIDSSSRSDYVKPLVVMPYMKHGDLRTYLLKVKKHGKKNYSIGQLIEFTLQIARGMSFLSKKKYIHRDLAARNCMLDGEKNNYTVKIADFGLARKIYSSTYQMKKLTKLPFKWLAPEALQYFTFTTKSDVWAFGVTMWEIFSFGEYPYSGVDNCDLLKYLSNRRLERPKACPDNMWEVIEDCWRKTPQRRPSFEMLEQRLQKNHSDWSRNTYIPIRNSYITVGVHGSSDA